LFRLQKDDTLGRVLCIWLENTCKINNAFHTAKLYDGLGMQIW
jgi:hypothetical protein